MKHTTKHTLEHWVGLVLLVLSCCGTYARKKLCRTLSVDTWTMIGLGLLLLAFWLLLARTSYALFLKILTRSV
jgi:hypothetical protein